MSVGPRLEKFNIVSNKHGRYKKAILAIQFVKPILQTITHLEVVYVTIGNPAFFLLLYLTGVHFRGEWQYVGDVSDQKSSVDKSELEKQVVSDCIQYTVLEIQFWSVKCTTVTVRYVKISSISIPSHQAMQAIAMVRLYENKPLQNAFKRI